MPHLVPIVIEQEARGERSYDIYSRLLKDRLVMLDTEVTPNSSSLIVSQLLFLESEDVKKPIHFYINSPGGLVTAGLAIYDTMQYLKSPVYTYVIGQACSMGSLLAQAGASGYRYMLAHARHMIHQPSGGAQGQATDIQIHAEEILKLKKELTQIYVDHNSKGKTFEELSRDMERDKYFNAQESLQYGLIDKILTKRE